MTGHTTATLTLWIGGSASNEAVPLLSPSLPIRADPSSCRSRARAPSAVDVHRVAQDGEIALLLRRGRARSRLHESPPFSLRHTGRAARTGARPWLEGHDVDRVGVLRVDDDGKSEVGRQSLGNRSPRVAVVVAAQLPMSGRGRQAVSPPSRRDSAYKAGRVRRRARRSCARTDRTRDTDPVRIRRRRLD